MRRLLLVISVLGFGLFTTAYVISFVSPLLLETVAREIVRIEVQRRVGAKIEALTNSRAVSLAERALEKVDVDLGAAKRMLAEEVPKKVAAHVADMLNADCECRKRMTEAAVRNQEGRVGALTQMRERLLALIETTYVSVTQSLLREARIFTGTNAAAFALLGLISFFRRGASLQLLLPAVVLLAAVSVTGGLYLFNQDWLHTILYNDYVGLSYVGYLALVTAFFGDVVFNRARITTEIFNGLSQVVGSTVQAVSC